MTAQALPASDFNARQQHVSQLMKQAGQGSMSITDLFSAAQRLVDDGQAPLAIALYRLWLEKTVSPLSFAVCFNMAVTVANENDTAEAESLYRRAIALNPQFIEARLNLGTLLERLARPDEALATWREILSVLTPGDLATRAHYIQALNNLGRLLEIRKNFPDAEQMLAQSLTLDPEQPNVMTHWVHLRQKQCKWPVYSGLEHISLEAMIGGTSALAMLSASDEPSRQLAAARRFVDEKVHSAVGHLTGEHGYGHDRLRIGYLSSDFNSHAVSILTAELYELHDRSKVEVYGFCWSNEDNSPIRARVVRAMDHYVRIAGISDEDAARLIRSHEIDILVDLHGLTLGARPDIIAYRPAPVQMTYLGFPGTTALPGIDYVIADEFVLPPETAAFFTEKPLYLPGTFQINDRKRLIGNRPTRAANNLPEDAFVFCSFNNNFKFTPEVFASWMRILGRVPDSVLWIVADNELVRENLCCRAEEAGIERKRLVFATRALPADYLARFQIADLFLDTYPFGAGTTASDALWAGLPLLTRAGPVFASRMAGSLLRAVDLAELVTFSVQEYEDKAVALAADRPRIAAMKQQLQDNHLSCALFDSPQFVRNLEAAFQRVARSAPHPSESLPPMPIDVNRIPIITVSYNSPDLINALLGTLRAFYPENPVYVIDGSRSEVAAQIKPVTESYAGVSFIPFGYNIHHGPGMTWAIENLGLTGPVLFIDSDVEILKRGFLESLADELTPELYGVGGIQQVNEHGYDRDDGAVAYLHPACMLVNIEVMRRWPMPIKHGAPLILAMLALHRAGQSHLLKHMDWVKHDFRTNENRIFIKHDWQGTVIRTGGYHYDLPVASANIDGDLLRFVPPQAAKVVEIGCGDGSFAKAYKQGNPLCDYIGIELDKNAAELARPHCDFVFNLDAGRDGAAYARRAAHADCWILGDVLQRLDDPWAMLAAIRKSIAPGGTVLVSLPNFQHWSQQVRINLGDLRYQDGTPLNGQDRWVFSRGTILQMFQLAGFQINGGMPCIRDEPERDKYLPALRLLSQASGNDPDVAVQDALPWQYIVSAIAV
jgi:predicted O-linked N-acetylglucosamine transferase (SPINDLY family)/SAM-dependent methyltransferase